MDKPSHQDLIPIRSAAFRLSVCAKTIHNMINDGRLRGVRVGRQQKRVERASLDEFIRANRVSAS